MKHFILAFVLAVICYVFFYHYIEHRRTRKGPWEVTFRLTNSPAGTPLPMLVVSQPKLSIRNAAIAFPDQPAVETNHLGTFRFSQPQPVPFEVGFGKCVFMDTTFLPGTLTFELFGHQVELLPRVLVIDRQEHPWISHSTITVLPVQTNPTDPQRIPAQASSSRY